MIKVGNLDELFTSVIYSSRCLLRYLITHPVLSYPSSSSPSSLLFSSLISLIFFTVLLLHVHFSPLSCLSCLFHLIHPLQLFVFLPLSTVSFYPSFSMILLFIALFFPPPVPSGLLSLRFSPLDYILLSSPEGKWFSSFLHFSALPLHLLWSLVLHFITTSTQARQTTFIPNLQTLLSAARAEKEAEILYVK